MSTVWIGMVALAAVLFTAAAVVGYQRGLRWSQSERELILSQTTLEAGQVMQSAREGAMDIVDQLRSQAQVEAARITDDARGVAEVDDIELLERIESALRDGESLADWEMANLTPAEAARLALTAVRG